MAMQPRNFRLQDQFMVRAGRLARGAIAPILRRYYGMQHCNSLRSRESELCATPWESADGCGTEKNSTQSTKGQHTLSLQVV